jgi:hypothetical protein
MSNRRDTFAFAVTCAAVLVAAVGCSAGNAAAGGERPELALRRGASWVSYRVAPPNITGPTANLALDRQGMRGFLDSRAVNVDIAPGRADGLAGSGPVQLIITGQAGETAVDGMWNAGMVHVRFQPQRVTGTVVVRSWRTGGGLDCGYQLARKQPEGSFDGLSTCAGLPLETRLELPAAVVRALDPDQLAVLLVAALAAPPLGPQESL